MGNENKQARVQQNPPKEFLKFATYNENPIERVAAVAWGGEKSELEFVARKIASRCSRDVVVTAAHHVDVEDKSDRSSSGGNCLRGKLFRATKDRVNRVLDLDCATTIDATIARRVMILVYISNPGNEVALDYPI